MVQEIKITKLKTAAYNPRITLAPKMAEYEKLKNSIETFGNVEPIVWNKRTGNVVGGHQRLTVLKDLGYKSVPCSVVDLDENDEKLLNIALNKIKGKWDYNKLEAVLKDFDNEIALASGFSAEELAVLLASNNDLCSDEDYGDWEDLGEENAEEDAIAGSYVITLIFQNSGNVTEWAEKEGFDAKPRDGSRSTVIRIEE